MLRMYRWREGNCYCHDQEVWFNMKKFVNPIPDPVLNRVDKAAVQTAYMHQMAGAAPAPFGAPYSLGLLGGLWK